MEGPNMQVSSSGRQVVDEHLIAFKVFISKYLEPQAKGRIDKGEVYSRYFKWLTTHHISSEKCRYLSINPNDNLDENEGVRLRYSLSSSAEINWKYLSTVKVELRALKRVFYEQWPKLKGQSKRYLAVKVEFIIKSLNCLR
jgi:hypothetical protein